MKNRIIAAITFAVAIAYTFLFFCIPVAITAFIWTGQSFYGGIALTCANWVLFLSVIIALSMKQ